MPGIVRKTQDHHTGHASPSPNGFHQTSYAEGSPNTFVNGTAAVRIGDKTGCGDPATAGSSNIFINGIAVHRLGDSTGGHASWVPNASTTSSTNVYANDVSGAQGDVDDDKASASNNTVSGATVVSTAELQMAVSPFTQTVDSSCTAYNFTTSVCGD
jgi:uncharacterized Zn-binding protein involved in type VI secretion